MRVIAHVSDTHFGNDVKDPADRAAAVIEHLVSMSPRPDVLVVTGDLADHGLPEEYAAARAWLDLWPGPLAVCPGNHDVRQAFVEGLGVSSRSVVEVGDLRFVMLDSLIDAVDGVRVDEGRIGDHQQAWLDGQLAALRPHEEACQTRTGRCLRGGDALQCRSTRGGTCQGGGWSYRD